MLLLLLLELLLVLLGEDRHLLLLLREHLGEVDRLLAVRGDWRDRVRRWFSIILRVEVRVRDGILLRGQGRRG